MTHTLDMFEYWPFQWSKFELEFHAVCFASIIDGIQSAELIGEPLPGKEPTVQLGTDIGHYSDNQTGHGPSRQGGK